MGVRFRKTIKLTKGCKINVAKTGVSLSLGGRGHSINVGKNGPTATVGIPGTGISYRQKIGSTHNTTAKPTKSSSSTNKPSGSIQMIMNEKGHVVLIDGNGNEITDQSVIRRIQATPQYAQQKAMLEIQRKEKIDEMVNDSQVENDAFINIYKLSPIVINEDAFVDLLNSIKPEEYVETPFDIPKPTEEQIREELTAEAMESVKASIFTAGKLRKKYVNDNFNTRFSDAITKWESEKCAYESRIIEEKKKAQIEMEEECNNRKAFVKSLIDGNEDAISEEFDNWISSCELPVEININYEFDSNSQGLMLDVDLPEIEDIPSTIMTKTDAGNLKEKKKTQADLKKEYTTLTFGLAVFITANVFNISPAIKNVLISGYTQRRDSQGNMNDDYIYSIKFKREAFEGADLIEIDPKNFCFASENRCNLTASSLFKTIVPYEKI